MSTTGREAARPLVRNRGDGSDEVCRVVFLPGAHAPQVWRAVTTAAGINVELRPLLKMTVPRGLPAKLDLNDVPLCKAIGRSWILLGGLVPIDFDDVMLVEREPGRRFLERSATSTARVWQHERIVEVHDGGVLLTDRLIFRVRAHMALTRPVYRHIIAALFRYRHANLRRIFAPSVTSTRP